MKNHKEALVVLLILTSIIFIIYVNSLGNSFHYDDFHSFVNNRYVTNISNIPAFFTSTHMFSDIETGSRSMAYRPILLTTYALNYYFLGGFDPRGFRLFNILCHIAACFALYLLIKELTRDSLTAFFAAAFFAVTPFNTEMINYISSRSTAMATFFSLIAFLFHVKLRNTGRFYFYPLSIFSLLLAIGSKQTAIVLPGILFVYDIYFLPERGKDLLKKLWPYSIFAVGGFFYLTGFSILGFLAGVVKGNGIRAFYPNLLTQLVITLKYIKMFFIPTGLSIDHNITIVRSAIEPLGILGIGGNLLLLATSAFLYIKKKKLQSFCILFFYIASLPTIIIPFNVMLFENRGYFPLVGFAIIAGTFIKWLVIQKERPWSKGVRPALVLLLILAAFTVMQRNHEWKNVETIWKSVLKTNPNSYKAYSALGAHYEENGETDKAIIQYQKSIKIAPSYFIPYIKIGTIYQRRGDFSKAIELYEKALKYDRNYVATHYNLAIIFHQRKEFEKAEFEYKKTLEINPHHFMAHYNLGNLYLDLKRDAMAIVKFQDSIKENPQFPDSYYNIATAYDTIDNAERAIEYFNKYIKLAPEKHASYIAYSKSRIDALSRFSLAPDKKTKPE